MNGFMSSKAVVQATSAQTKPKGLFVKWFLDKIWLHCCVLDFM